MEYIILCDMVQCVSLSGTIPLGYKYEADKNSSETHNIPVPPDEFGGETDYVKILLSVKRFLTVSVELMRPSLMNTSASSIILPGFCLACQRNVGASSG
jgi:hypothetical protein